MKLYEFVVNPLFAEKLQKIKMNDEQFHRIRWAFLKKLIRCKPERSRVLLGYGPVIRPIRRELYPNVVPVYLKWFLCFWNGPPMWNKIYFAFHYQWTWELVLKILEFRFDRLTIYCSVPTCIHTLKSSSMAGHFVYFGPCKFQTPQTLKLSWSTHNENLTPCSTHWDLLNLRRI